MPASPQQASPRPRITNEALLTQNPALGAVILWRFACGYQQGHKTRDSVPLPLAFTVLPIIFHRTLLDVLAHTQKDSGLRKFAEKFADTRDARQDVLLSIHDRCTKWRDISWASLRIAFAAKLLTLTTEGVLIPLTETAPGGLPSRTATLLRSSEKLGSWFAVLSIHEVATLLKVRF